MINAANDNELHLAVQNLKDSLEDLEEYAEELTTADLDEVKRLYLILQDMMEDY